MRLAVNHLHGRRPSSVTRPETLLPFPPSFWKVEGDAPSCCWSRLRLLRFAAQDCCSTPMDPSPAFSGRRRFPPFLLLQLTAGGVAADTAGFALHHQRPEHRLWLQLQLLVSTRGPLSAT